MNFFMLWLLGGVQSNFAELQLSNGENQGASGFAPNI
jgi:hypothetical protein